MDFLKNLKPLHYVIIGLIVIALAALIYNQTQKKETIDPDASSDVSVYSVSVSKTDEDTPGAGGESCSVPSCFRISDGGAINFTINSQFENCSPANTTGVSAAVTPYSGATAGTQHTFAGLSIAAGTHTNAQSYSFPITQSFSDIDSINYDLTWGVGQTAHYSIPVCN